MNAVLLKALADDIKKQQQQQVYAEKFNTLEKNYRDAMEKAYGLESADEYAREGWFGRGADIAKSWLYGAFPGEVAEGRAGMKDMNPLLVDLLRSQGFQDAFQGAREAEMQIPTSPLGLLNFFKNVRESRNIPYSVDDPRILRRQAIQNSNKSAFDDMMKKVYGEKQGK
jgi:hypothetical protein